VLGRQLLTSAAEKKIVTGAYLCDPKQLEYINCFVDDVLRLAERAPARRLEIVLHLMLDDEENKMDCGYYFVDHESRLLLWGEKFDISAFLWEAKGTMSAQHIRADFCSFLVSIIRINIDYQGTKLNWNTGMFMESTSVRCSTFRQLKHSPISDSGFPVS
jgi:hypothetical protein